ncbi:uncharacterized protein (TIGR04141 family) [Saccharopolyspora phatthalungensis]|uniref:Uncharacterized protein (TIGR04141 family) n=1 Tax=Saccharopolyspora phatthalungensis TaxID=664693 RepID=A0A840QH15_9PSEU|nr:uncharacterized protein (TIGR04141 family) [Saccharopolyspora phatthalungensis]
MARRTSKHTLYRLVGVDPARLYDAVDLAQVDKIGGDINDAPNLTGLGIEALIAHGGMIREEAPWCEELRRTSGFEVSEPTWRSAGLLVLAVDGEVYAIGYDQGFRLIPDHLKDKDFGLTFALRAVDPDSVCGITSKVLGQGRTDITMIPGGMSVSMLDIKEYLRIVHKVAGAIADIDLTRTRFGKSQVTKADGGSGLLIQLGIEPHDLVADIREVARVCQEHRPHPDLEFVERVKPVRNKATMNTLDEALDDVLRDPTRGQVTAAVPIDHLDS